MSSPRSMPGGWPRDPSLVWLLVLLAALVALAVGMPSLEPLFKAAFPALDRPMYRQEGFGSLLVAHLAIVAASSAASMVMGVAAAVFVTRDAGRDFRPLVETLVAIGQTVPPVAVLALAVPLIGFGAWPALVALSIYGLLPIVRATIAGIESVDPAVIGVADGLGLSPLQRLRRIELPLAMPVIISGLRSSVAINIGTAAIASAVGAKTLGSPIVIGLAGFNTAYVIQGALVVGLLAVVVDLAFGRWASHTVRWRSA